MAPPLKGLIISAIGDLGPSNSNDNLRRWVERNGGKWMARVVPGLTHLICGKEAWKRNVDAVKQAKKINALIVSFEWLEDSLQKHRRLAEKKYTWEVIRGQRRTSKKLKRLAPQADTKKFNDGCDQAMTDIGSGTSAKRRSSFFGSALEDLKTKREARERQEAEKVKSLGLGIATSDQDASSRSSQDQTRSVSGSATASFPLQPAMHQPEHPTATNPSIAVPQHPRQPFTPTSSTSVSSPLPSPPQPQAPAPPHQPASAEAKLPDLYHRYLDPTGFDHSLFLVRLNLHLNTYARFDLRMYESHTKPHVYCTIARYIPPGKTSAAATPALTPNTTNSGTTSSQEAHPEALRLRALVTPTPLIPPGPGTSPFKRILAPPNSSFATAFRAFRHAFRDLTLLAWEERLQPPGPAGLQALRARAMGRAEPFVWRRPAEGLTVGVVVKGYGVAEEVGRGYVWDEWGLWRGVYGEANAMSTSVNVAPAQTETEASGDAEMSKKKKSTPASKRQPTPSNLKMRSTASFTPPPTPRKGNGISNGGVTICDYRTAKQKRDAARDRSWGW